jgi:hypothetical protein
VDETKVLFRFKLHCASILISRTHTNRKFSHEVAEDGEELVDSTRYPFMIQNTLFFFKIQIGMWLIRQWFFLFSFLLISISFLERIETSRCSCCEVGGNEFDKVI